MTTARTGWRPPDRAISSARRSRPLDVEPAGVERATVDNADAYADVDLDADRLPTTVTGVVDDGSRDDDHVVAVVVNGEVAAVTRTYESDGTQFYALVPPSVFVDGRNDVELLLVEGTGTNRTLRHLDD